MLEGKDECQLSLREFQLRRELTPSSSSLQDQDGFVGSGSSTIRGRLWVLLMPRLRFLRGLRLQWCGGGFLATNSHKPIALGEEVMQCLQRLLSLRESLRKPVHSRAKKAFHEDRGIEEGHLFGIPYFS